MSCYCAQLFPLVDSLGLNEQELGFLSRVHNGPWGEDLYSADSDGLPVPDRVLDILTWVLRKHGSRLSRVHLHSLGYHVTALAPNSSWLNQKSATLAGARVSGQIACDSVRPAAQDMQLRLPVYLRRGGGAPWETWDSRQPLLHWTVSDELQFYLAPVLVCRQPKRTVGLGDAISSTGLLYSGFRFDKL